MAERMHKMDSRKDALNEWLRSYIIALKLCPFAESTVKNDEFSFYVIDAFEPNTLSRFLVDYGKNFTSYKTSFLALPLDWKYEESLDIFYYLQDLAADVDLLSDIKLVLFHPDYKHGRTATHKVLDDYSNRCPIPLIQILSEKDVKSRAATIDVDTILNNNSNTLERIGVAKLDEILNGLTTKN